jgi:hypothetical protein
MGQEHALRLHPFIPSSLHHSSSNSGRPGGNRTPNLRFWRPPLCQLSYWPKSIFSVIPAQVTVLSTVIPAKAGTQTG